MKIETIRMLSEIGNYQILLKEISKLIDTLEPQNEYGDASIILAHRIHFEITTRLEKIIKIEDLNDERVIEFVSLLWEKIKNKCPADDLHIALLNQDPGMN